MNVVASIGAVRVPRVAAPPHDPKSLLLAGWIGPQPSDGWRLARFAGTELSMPQATLQLARTPDAARRLTEAGGGLGGLRLPRHLALFPGDDLVLLDTERGRLLHFDACCCRFDPLPCGLRLADEPSGCETPATPRRLVPLNRLRTPAAIAACEDRLLIADSGHARVLVYARAGFVPRGALVLPPAQAAALGTPWQPVDLAFDRHGGLFALDALHGRIDRFDTRGHWSGPAIAAPGAEHLLVDRSGAPVVVVRELHLAATPALAQPLFLEIDGGHEHTDWQQLRIAGIAAGTSFDLALGVGNEPLGAAQLAQLPPGDWKRRADALGPAQDGQALPLALDTGRWLRARLVPRPASAAPALALTATAAQARRWHDGAWTTLDPRADRLQGAACVAAPWLADPSGHLFVACAGAWQAFDAHGAPVPDLSPPRPRYKRQGLVRSAMLDSGIDGCPWHRVELRGTIPPGCSVEVRTTTAPLPLPDAEIDTLDESAWCTRNLLSGSDARAHDCLVLSPPDRFLWLQLVLRGDGSATPCIESVLVEFPRISLRRYLPAVFGADPAGADFTDRFGALFDATLRSLERPLDRLAELFDPMATPAGSASERRRWPAGDRRGDFLGWLEQWVGIATVRDLPEQERRRFLANAGALFGLRGTREGLWRQLLLLLGMDAAGAHCADLRPQRRCVPLPLNCATGPSRTSAPPPPLILEHFKLRRWLHAGAGRLGADSQLWGASIVNRSQLGANAQVGVTQTRSVPDPLRDPLHVHADRYSVFVPVAVRGDPPLARALERLLAAETPAHVEADLRWVAPRFTVGRQAMVGLDSVVARTPQCGVTLAAEGLGQGTVLSAGPGRAAQGMAPRIGAGRIGTGNVLH